ncbi:MAG: hypothetical protein RSB04_06430 [Gordonibacter sp.]|uniref:hypothetical protein n=1 Tax=Gordonibacter sp. TaxID=1968902 RepID=UPI002FC6DC61
MSAPEPIIEVKPVTSTQGAAHGAAKKSTASAGTTAGGDAFRTPSYGRKAVSGEGAAASPAAQTVTQATVIGETGSATATKAPSRTAGAVQLVAGSAIALVGVPLLLLPGPGLLAIGGGVALAVGGLKKLRRGK